MPSDDCRMCGEQISTDREQCPSCGYKPQKTLGIFGLILAGVGATVAIIWSMYAWIIAIVGILFLLAAPYSKPTM